MRTPLDHLSVFSGGHFHVNFSIQFVHGNAILFILVLRRHMIPELVSLELAQTTIFGPIILILAAMSVLNKRFVYLGASSICLHFKPIFHLYWGQALMFLFILGAMTFCHFGK